MTVIFNSMFMSIRQIGYIQAYVTIGLTSMAIFYDQI